MSYNFTPDYASRYVCKKCDFNSNKYSDYKRHIATIKHANVTNSYKSDTNIKKYVCDCGKSYKHRQNLYSHKKKCNFVPTESKLENQLIKTDEENMDYKKMFMTMITENKELRDIVVSQQNQISELIPKIGNNNTINKNKFNINVFLNEQCKDALTMNEFISDIKISIEDLMHTKNKGISEGVSNIFIKNMNKLSLYERPIHCTDVKRETVYIKSEGGDGDTTQWEKDKEQEKFKKAINDMKFVQSKFLNLYTDDNPDWMEKEQKQDEYMAMVKNCMDDIKKDNRQNKVIKKVCNNVYVNINEIE